MGTILWHILQSVIAEHRSANVVSKDVKVPWLISGSFYTISDYLLCCNKFVSAAFFLFLLFSLNLSHFGALGWKRNFFSERLNRFVSRQALNYLICYYEIIIPSNWTYTENDKISLILIYALLAFLLLEGDDKFSFEECGQFILLCRLRHRDRNHSGDFFIAVKNPLIIDSESLSYFVVFVVFPPQIHRLSLCLIND